MYVSTLAGEGLEESIAESDFGRRVGLRLRTLDTDPPEL